MSLVRQLVRVFDTFDRIDLDEEGRFGAAGEDDAARLLASTSACVVRNPVLPILGRPRAFLESDLLAHADGGLFVVEIKARRGRQFYGRRRAARPPDGGWSRD